MIIAKGRLFETKEQDKILATLEEEINITLATKALAPETVINAVDKLCDKVKNGDFDELIASLPIDGAEHYKQIALKMLSRESIEYKLKTELGEDFFTSFETSPPHGMKKLGVRACPLGVLLHIAAGNVDGLPAFSLAEGLLTGNINILKLPQADNDLSVRIIAELIKLEPQLADFIYVFDTPSSDIAAMQKMAQLCDGIVLWGGEVASAAVRKLAPAGVKLIEWGHKLSFAYISGFENKEEELTALAEHIVTTKGLLCSSCQVIYIDTDSYEKVEAFCDEFFPYLRSAAEKHISPGIDARAEISLREYTSKLETLITGQQPEKYTSPLCALVPKQDSALELSDMFSSVLVKPLPQSDIVNVLRKSKGYLQTAGLICDSEKRAQLTDILCCCGLVRIMRAGEMSEAFCGEAHDGEYPLRRYVRMVNFR